MAVNGPDPVTPRRLRRIAAELLGESPDLNVADRQQLRRICEVPEEADYERLKRLAGRLRSGDTP